MVVEANSASASARISRGRFGKFMAVVLVGGNVGIMIFAIKSLNT
jgi:hypothetical protein